MIDLHTHTKSSDGTWSVEKLLTEAQKSKIEILSITDHDTLKAYEDLKDKKIRSNYMGKIIPGIELSSVYDGIFFHLLAYDFDIKKLSPWVHEKYESNAIDLNREFDYMINNCKKNNVKIDKLNYNKSMGWPIEIIYPEIKKHSDNKKLFNEEEWNNIDIFYNSCITNKEFPAYVDFSIHYPKANEVADAVKNAGGKLFIAHLFKYNLKNPIKFLDELKDDKIIDGVEVYHSSFNEKQFKVLEEYCKKNNLLMSGGSDCHGDKKKNRKIGTGFDNLNISRLILNDWNLKSMYI